MSPGLRVVLPSPLEPLDRSLAAVLRGDAAGPPPSVDPDHWIGRAEYHGLLPLLDERLPPDPAPWRLRIAAMARQAVASDLLREAALRTALDAFAAAGVRVLLLKGVHLAYVWYARPDLRPRLDSDILIEPEARATVDRVLSTLGYRQPGHTTGELLSYQTPYELWRDGLRIHVFDVHWRVANPQAFGEALPFDDLAGAAVPLPALGPSAHGLSPVHALILACTHRVAHHFDSNRLIWLYDIHLIASALTPDEWAQLLSFAERWHVTGVCRHSLERAVSCFATVIPDHVAAAMRVPLAAGNLTTAYLGPRRHLTHILTDLQALGGWRDRVRLMRQHVFPPREYMRGVYAGSSRAPLMYLYAQRVVRGARRWLIKPRDEWTAAR